MAAKNIKNLQVTSLEMLGNFAKGEVVELPPFVEGQSFIARVRRPSLLTLVKDGRIPNTLLKAANDLFMRGGIPADKLNDESGFKDTCDIFNLIAEASLVEPTYQDITEAGLSLTDQQLVAIFNYSQMGVKALEPFRSQP